ncbi:MAG: MFS transporter [Candidatus Dormiibacterota bacterium]
MRSAAEQTVDRRYTTYLIVIALAGWALASYDFNLLVLAYPNVAQDLHLSASLVGLLGLVIYVFMLVISLLVGYGMDVRGRKWMWMVCLVGAAVFTGLTFFVQNFWELAAVRALASGFANAELAISITLVNEQVPSQHRGFLYSIVQGGWPLGVFLASGVYLAFIGLGWRTVFLFGVVPIVIVIIGRIWIRESPRYEHLRAVKAAVAAGDEPRVKQLLQEHEVDLSEVEKVTVAQLFTTAGYVRRQLSLVTLVWMCYAISWVATNVYITYWLTSYKGWTSGQAATLLLVCGGIGYLFYLLGGLLGERYGRREVLILTGILTGPLNLLFLLTHAFAPVAIVYFAIYQATNGTWSGAGYAYWAETFPTRVRGTAIGWLGATFTFGQIVGTLLWTLLIGTAGPTVTWLVIAVAFGCCQTTALLLRRVPPHQELEQIAT